MEHDAGFHRSIYLTLALATLCLVYSELAYLPDFLIWLVPISVLFAGAYAAEGRAVMPAWAANVLAVLIFACVCGWIASRITAGDDPILLSTPLPTALLPYLGPLLIVLLLVKLFRPKQIGDIWLLYALGVMEVGLGCVLAGDLTFGGLLLAYLASLAYSLAIFYQFRQQATPASSAGARRRPPLARPRPLETLRWVLAVNLAALVLFLLTPRPSESQWNSLALARGVQQKLETGYSSEIDINRTGRVEVNNELAFTVVVTAADGSPKSDLDRNQLWRASIFDQYHDGRWTNGTLSAIPNEISSLRVLSSLQRSRAIMDPLRDPGPPRKWVDLGPSQYFMQFTLTPRHALVLAEPSFFESGKPLTPVQGMDEAAGVDLFHEPEGFAALVPMYVLRSGRPKYRQVLAPMSEPEVGLPVQISEGYVTHIDGQTNAGIDDWTDELLVRLASGPRAALTPGDIAKVPRSGSRSRSVRPFALSRDKWEKVARALCDHLAHSSEFTYTLDLHRQDSTIDPTLDFLRNVKSGHCERYATALALMLRSQGIPARILKGYRGADDIGNGSYEVRNSHAHSWVQALIDRPGVRGEPQLRWLTLDPTSANDTGGASSLSLSFLWEDFQALVQSFWREFIIDYSTERQSASAATLRENSARAWRNLSEHPQLLVVPAMTALLPIGWFMWRRRARRRDRSAEPGRRFPLYDRLLALVDRHCRLRPVTGQTAREFSFAAQEALLARVDFVQAGVPAEVIGAYYRVRFGGQLLGDGELARLTQRLDGLETSLRQGPAMQHRVPSN
jgi:transglutaminase-like putative cysteine protease